MKLVAQDKIAVNVSRITHILKTEDQYIAYFESGKPLHLPKEDAEYIVKNFKTEDGIEAFFHFSKNVFININKINYVKNNFENKKATKYKVTVAMPNGLEFFRAFELTDLDTAKELFSYLAQCV